MSLASSLRVSFALSDVVYFQKHSSIFLAWCADLACSDPTFKTESFVYYYQILTQMPFSYITLLFSSGIFAVPFNITHCNFDVIYCFAISFKARLMQSDLNTSSTKIFINNLTTLNYP